MPVGRTLYGGSPYLGVYLRADDRIAIVPSAVPPSLAREIARVLGVSVVRTNIGESEVVGALIAITARGAIVGDELSDEEREALAPVGPLTVIRSRQNAMGNNVLANDRGALVHPEFSESAVHAVSRALGVPARRGTIAGLGTVGRAGVATNRGVVLHPRATAAEVEGLGELFGVPVARSTANFGVPIVGACVVANSRGMIVGRPTTPVEIVHLQEGLGLFD